MEEKGLVFKKYHTLSISVVHLKRKTKHLQKTLTFEIFSASEWVHFYYKELHYSLGGINLSSLLKFLESSRLDEMLFSKENI